MARRKPDSTLLAHWLIWGLLSLSIILAALLTNIHIEREAVSMRINPVRVLSIELHCGNQSVQLRNAGEIAAFCTLWNETWMAQVEPFDATAYKPNRVPMPEQHPPAIQVTVRRTQNRVRYFTLEDIYIYDHGEDPNTIVNYFTCGGFFLRDAVAEWLEGAVDT